MGSKRVTALDAHIGGRVRERRVLLGQSGRQLAETIGVATQQVHKYETGIDRISAGLLYVFARALGTPIGYFYDGLDGEPRAGDQRQRRLLNLMQNIAEIPDERHQEAIGQIVRVLAER